MILSNEINATVLHNNINFRDKRFTYNYKTLTWLFAKIRHSLNYRKLSVQIFYAFLIRETIIFIK